MRTPELRRSRRSVASVLFLPLVLAPPALHAAQAPQSRPTIDGVPIPKIWDDAALADWATPVAGLGVAPSFLGAQTL